MKNKTLPDSGNALWFVLIAVALLALLTAVISSTGSMVEQTGNIEQARIRASAILRYTQAIETAIQQMIMRGTSQNDLDFVAVGPDHDNPNCTRDDCDVFSVEGGGIAFRSAPEVLGIPDFPGSWKVTAGNRINQSGCDEEGTECSELLLLLPGITQALCIQINKLQNVTNPGGIPPQQNEIFFEPFAGEYNGTDTYVLGGVNSNESPQLRGKSAGCLFHKSSNQYIFYQMLLAR